MCFLERQKSQNIYFRIQPDFGVLRHIYINEHSTELLQLFDDKTVSLSYLVLLPYSAQLARSCSDYGVVYRARSVITIPLANEIS